MPRVYGFKVHAAAALVRWQNGARDDMRRRLRKMEVESGFKDGEDDFDDDEEEDDPEEDEEQLALVRRDPALGAGPSGAYGGDAQMGSVA